MTLIDIIQSIGVVASMLISIIGGAKIITTFHDEKKKSAMSVGGEVIDDNRTALEVSQLAIQQVLDLKTEMRKMEIDTKETIRLQQEEIDRLKTEASEYKAEIDDLKDWAARLVFQVKSMGGNPVELRKSK